MLITATQIREGMILNLNDELYRVTYTMHITPGKGVACMQTKLKNILSGKNLEQRFRSSDRVEKADLETRSMQYLYRDDSGFIFMDTSDYEQYPISQDLVGDSEKYLVENEIYNISFYNSNAVGLELPLTVALKVITAPPEIKKATASSSLRPVTVENGMVVQAPGFIKEGDIIKISTQTDEYIERV